MRHLIRRYRTAIGLLTLGLVVLLWLLASCTSLQGAAARNAGFLAWNRSLVDAGNAAYAVQAAAALERAAALGPERASVWRTLGYARLNLNQPEGAVEAWRNDPRLSRELAGNGQAARRSGQPDEALAWFQYATQVAPDDVDAWLDLGAAFEARGNWQAAVETYGEGIARAGVPSGDLYFRLARARFNLGWPVDYNAVLNAADQALETDRFVHDWSRLQSHYFRGVALQGLGREREALAEFRIVAAERPDDYWGLVNLGALIWRLEGDAEAAEGYLRAALAVDSARKPAYLNLAEVYWATGRRAAAAELYRAVLTIDPADPTANSRLQEE